MIFKPGTSLSNTLASTLSFASEFFCLWGNGKNPKISHSITIKWLLPPSSWAKLNTDGASSGNPGIAGGWGGGGGGVCSRIVGGLRLEGFPDILALLLVFRLS